MSPDKVPPAWLSLLFYLGLFFGGGVSIWVASRVAPDSRLALFFSFLTLSAAFIPGIFGWAGAALPAAMRLLLWRRAARPGTDTSVPVTVIPGAYAFVPVALLVCLPTGALVGALSPSPGFLGTLLLYEGLGLAFGCICWQLARTGYPQFPRE
jgi:hypothetical protein